VAVLARRDSNNGALQGLDVEWAWGDLRDPVSVEAAVRGSERVYHTAAKVSSAETQYREIYECNVLGTRHVLHAALAQGVRRVVVTGSFSAVGHLPDRPSDESVPVNPFAQLALPALQGRRGHGCLKAVADGLTWDRHLLRHSRPHGHKPSRMASSCWIRAGRCARTSEVRVRGGATS
jgi:dihydroflavonol-4-reductase